jgi:hypothetical protein
MYVGKSSVRNIHRPVCNILIDDDDESSLALASNYCHPDPRVSMNVKFLTKYSSQFS